MRVEVDVPPVVEAIVKSGVLAAVDAELEIERREYGEVVPIPMFPLPCWTTNCELPMVNPWPVARVVVPVVPESVSVEPPVMRPDVCKVPAVVLRSPTPRPPVKYCEPTSPSVVDGDVVPMPMFPPKKAAA